MLDMRADIGRRVALIKRMKRGGQKLQRTQPWIVKGIHFLASDYSPRNSDPNTNATPCKGVSRQSLASAWNRISCPETDRI